MVTILLPTSVEVVEPYGDHRIHHWIPHSLTHFLTPSSMVLVSWVVMVSSLFLWLAVFLGWPDAESLCS